MKKYILSLFILLFTLEIYSQSISIAQSHYEAIEKLNRKNPHSSDVYAYAYKCYQECVPIMNNVNINSEEYNIAKQLLKNISPILYSGVVNYQNKSTDLFFQFADAYIELSNLECFENGSHKRNNDYYATVVYVAASKSYEAKNYNNAAKYMEYYLETNVIDKREDIFYFLTLVYCNLGDYANAFSVAEKGMREYPNSRKINYSAIDVAQISKDDERLQLYLSNALKYEPSNPKLLNNQGLLYERSGKYQSAYEIFLKLDKNNVYILKHLAINSYNLGVLNYNNALMANNSYDKERYIDTAQSYFKTAIPFFSDILAYDPTSVQFLKGLATIYMCLGDETKMTSYNNELNKYGEEIVTPGNIPVIAALDDSQNQKSVVSSSAEIPKYSHYAEQYVNEKLDIWTQKGDYETIAEHKKRVNRVAFEEKTQEFLTQAKYSYISKYATLGTLYIGNYDAENELFSVMSKYGELFVPVPRKNNEASIFESSWKGIRFTDPKYDIIGDELKLSQLTFITPSGLSYHYDIKNTYNYTEVEVNLNFKDFDYQSYAENKSIGSPIEVKHNKKIVNVGYSDVDINIPKGGAQNDNTYAIIFANEKYQYVADVPMAVNDGKVFREYCNLTLSIPNENIMYFENASYGVMLQEMERFFGIVDAIGSENINLIFYYAGHGVPDEKTKDGYIVPVDSDGKNSNACYSLKKLYSQLGSLQLNSIVVFMDACFSGRGRNEDMLISARGIEVTPTPVSLSGKMVVISATSEDQTALPYVDKGHGLFTYYLLKKLQETKGNVSLGDLYEYVYSNVDIQSQKINRKRQTPHVLESFRFSDTWRDHKMIVGKRK